MAFVAGFAEPFFLGVVKRVAEIGGSPAPEKEEPDRSKPRPGSAS